MDVLEGMIHKTKETPKKVKPQLLELRRTKCRQELLASLLRSKISIKQRPQGSHRAARSLGKVTANSSLRTLLYQ